MMGFLKEHFQEKALRRDAYLGDTGLLPLSEIHTATILMDADIWAFNECMETISNWLRANGIRGDFHFFDFRKLEKGELLLTSIQTTILRSNLNWFGCPDRSAILLTEQPTDLFISLVLNGDYPNKYMSACAKSRFKVGVVPYPGNPYDLVVSASEDSPTIKLFEKITEVLGRLA